MDRWAVRITSRWGAIVVLVGAALLTVLTFVTSPEQPAAEPTDGLPAGAESTKVTELQDRFPSGRRGTAIIVYERADGPLTDADRQAVAATRDALAGIGDGTLPPPEPAADGQAVLLVVPLQDGLDTEGQNEAIDRIRDVVADTARPDGLSAWVTGGAAFGRDIANAFAGADVTLLLATMVVVALLLVVTYRSPILWVVPLLVIGAGDQAVAKLLPWVARLIGERTDASVAGIVSVLVFGAGTDYALLLISRYREELRRADDRRAAMVAAMRGVAPAIVGSAGTVILALLTLLFAVLTSNRTLGISAAIGVAVALLFGLVVLPAALVSLPRGVFWPFVPKVDGGGDEQAGLWAKIARGVSRRPVAVLMVSIVLLGAMSAGLFRTEIGLAQTEQFRTEVESVDGQEALGRHFPAGAAQPVTVIADAADAAEVTAVARGVDGVADIGRQEASTDGTLVQISVELTAAPGTPAADEAVRDLRAALNDGTLVGGAPAADLDQRDAQTRDNVVIVPLILAVVLFVLVVLLRSLVGPVLILLTVVASYAASLGAASLLLLGPFGFPALDTGVPLLGFLFLVALGVDYNLFLVTRAREETILRGDTKAGTVRGLAATGGVITAAGVLLAAVFTVLGVLPVIVLTQLGIVVGIGVLLDTLVVRTLVVPAIALTLGERFWWPAKPAALAVPGRHAAGVSPRPAEEDLPAPR
ncbi:MMPL family transporter [Virgisporangium ochraceum]|uniref:Membrane protein n=1 Tax=Virgisporangium ochraceum TaxID=65505 RepID=A0A8J3ZU05_9ACTN|nr:MMPL family transporter [Virgisporangium ochraceum]GIJ69601.1 membrane protein [Virgisporangium ochraceum]